MTWGILPASLGSPDFLRRKCRAVAGRHVDQNLIQVRLKFPHLFFGEFQVGQIGDVADFLFGDLQASSLLREAL